MIRMKEQTKERRGGVWAASGVLGALLASSCCIAPLLFVTLGVSGAWIGNLTVLEPYKWVFIAIAVVFLALGFRHAYFPPRRDCEDGAICARPTSGWTTKVSHWIGLALVVLAATVDWWAPAFY